MIGKLTFITKIIVGAVGTIQGVIFMNKLLILPLVVLLTACVDSLGVAKQDYTCRNDGGVYEYAHTRKGVVVCRSGIIYDSSEWRSKILPSEYYPVVEDKK